ncbi:MAG: hypothetical protein JNG85_07855 [Spirochaetaceae bacterium]|nr:hypothetical protein [Spirochaetaceae bacterium]
MGLEAFFQVLSRESGVSILHRELPRAELGLHLRGATVPAAAEAALRKFPDYVVEPGESSLFVARREAAPSRGEAGEGELYLSYNAQAGTADLRVERRRLSEVLKRLFGAAGREYVLAARNDPLLERVACSARPFDACLELLLAQTGNGCALRDGVYVIFQSPQQDALRSLRSTVVRPLAHLSVADLLAALPPTLAASGALKPDRAANVVYLTGTDEELESLGAFLSAVDRPLDANPYRRFDLSRLKPKELLAVLPPRLAGPNPVAVPGADAVLLQCSAESRDEVARFVASVDQAGEPSRIPLKYVKPEEALRSLPPPFLKEELVDLGDGATLLFAGSAGRRALLERYLAIVDKPRPQIRYELLVVQYERSASSEWKRSLENRKAKAPSASVVIGNLAELLSLEFDVVSAFGYLFAARLSLELGESRARIFADTTLNGLAGQDIRFQNTSTFRYRELDPSTGKPLPTGVTREIASGMIVAVNGWVSGDGMITMNVSATLSKRGADLSSSTGNPPPTSEKVVTTSVRTRSGEPVVISGLFQEDESESLSGLPFLARVPLLGRLFSDSKRTREGSEMVIYVLPWNERDPGASVSIERVYAEVVGRPEAR